MKISEILRKLQNQSATVRKTILWVTVVIIGSGLFIWWLRNFQEKLKIFQEERLKEEFEMPSLKELPQIEMPTVEIPALSEEELKKLEEALKETKPGNQE